MRAFVAAATSDVVPGSTFNVTSGRNVELRTIIDLVGSELGRTVPTEFTPSQAGDPLVISGDNTATLSGARLGAEHHRYRRYCRPSRVDQIRFEGVSTGSVCACNTWHIDVDLGSFVESAPIRTKLHTC